MVDISMCSGKDCPSKNLCYRYTATPSLHQSYLIPMYDHDKKECEYFLSNHSHFVGNHSHYRVPKAMRSKVFWYDWIILFMFIMFGAEAKSSNHDGFATIWAFLAGWWGLFMLLNYLGWIKGDK